MNKYQEALNEIKNIVLDKSGDGYRTAKYLLLKSERSWL